MASDSPLSAHELRRLSSIAFVDPRTLSKALSGARVLPMTLIRIERTLRDHGLEHLIPPKRLQHPNRGSR